MRHGDAANRVRASDTSGIVVITEVQPITTLFSLPQEMLSFVLAKMGREAQAISLNQYKAGALSFLHIATAQAAPYSALRTELGFRGAQFSVNVALIKALRG